MTSCASLNLIVTAQTYYSRMEVYDDNGSYKQNLQYGTIQALDCSAKYLVAVDNSGYISINTSAGSIDTDGFPGWAIGLIVGVVVLFIIVAVVIKFVKKKRAKAAMGINNYNQIDNQIPPPQPYFPNNQGYNPVIVPSNQAFNQNQGYAPNQGYNPYPTQNTNPYSANQPRNWS